MLEDQERVFDLWHQFRDQKIDRAALRTRTSVILARMKHNLRLAAQTDHKAARNLGKSLLENWDKLWTFLRVDGVEPTNNSAERILRPLVILKRIFQRLPSEGGRACPKTPYSAKFVAQGRVRTWQISCRAIP